MDIINQFENAIARMRSTDVNESIIGDESEVTKKYYPKTLKHTHREILRLHVLGYSGNEIAEMLDITPVVVSYTINSGLGKKILAQMELEMDATVTDVKEKFSKLAIASVATIADIMVNGDKSSDRLRAAQDLLDRAGHKPVEKKLSGVFSASDIDRIKNAVGKVNNANIVDDETT